jgi:hypothetical protein
MQCIPQLDCGILQYIVEDGILEVDGPPLEEYGQMCLKYAELRDAAHFWVQRLEDGTETFRDLEGFRLLRMARVRERDIPHQQNIWSTVEVRSGTLGAFVGSQRLIPFKGTHFGSGHSQRLFAIIPRSGLKQLYCCE